MHATNKKHMHATCMFFSRVTLPNNLAVQKKYVRLSDYFPPNNHNTIIISALYYTTGTLMFPAFFKQQNCTVSREKSLQVVSCNLDPDEVHCDSACAVKNALLTCASGLNEVWELLVNQPESRSDLVARLLAWD